MINSVKELRQININGKFAFLSDDIPYLQYRLLAFLFGLKPKLLVEKNGSNNGVSI
ncbi:MAG: hypothetical protein ACJAT7_003561 [Psychromonas sp.]|jgi:hypothetical protein